MRAVALATLALVAVAGCSTGDGRSLPPAEAPLPATTTTTVPTGSATSFRVVSPWQSDGIVPGRYGCGTDVAAPAISWSGVPEGASELAVVFSTDGTADAALIGIDPAQDGLTESALPTGSFWWPPSDVDARWTGLCADDVDAEYQFTVYALNQQVEAADGTSVTELVGLLALTAIGQATVTGRLDVPPPT